MSDAIQLRVNNCEEECTEIRGRVAACEELYDIHTKQIDRLLRWSLDGNGESAEHRIKDLEKEMSCLSEKLPELITREDADKIAKSSYHHFIESARSKDRTWVSKIKAVALVMGPVSAIIVALIALLR